MNLNFCVCLLNCLINLEDTSATLVLHLDLRRQYYTKCHHEEGFQFAIWSFQR